MGISRHREQRETETHLNGKETPMQKKIREDLKDFALNLQQEIKAEEKKPEEKKVVKKKDEPKKIIGEAKKEEFEKEPQTNIGIVGSSIEVKEFRAIVKKKGMYINVVLAKIIHDWNKENYNL